MNNSIIAEGCSHNAGEASFSIPKHTASKWQQVLALRICKRGEKFGLGARRCSGRSAALARQGSSQGDHPAEVRVHERQVAFVGHSLDFFFASFFCVKTKEKKSKSALKRMNSDNKVSLYQRIKER